MNPVLVELTRGSYLESVYRGAAVVVDATGDIKYSIGSIDDLTFPRSSIKSVQALPLIETGAADAFGFSVEEIALTCASHNGESLHVDLGRSMLKKAGLPEDALKCGTHWPLGRESGRSLLRSDSQATDFHNNCSGKHAGMLAVCVHLGWPIDNYTDPEHPLQKRVVELLSMLSGEDLDASQYGYDGCSLPNWPLSLRGLARAFVKIASGEGLKAEHGAGFKRLIDAGFQAPEVMGGALSRRFVTEILRGFSGRIYVKEGAEGVYGGALLDKGLGIAVKIDDGSRRSSEIVMANIIATFAGLTGDNGILDAYRSVALKTWSGEGVGSISPSEEFIQSLAGT